MDCTEHYHESQFTSDDLAKLKAVVRSNASSGTSPADVEEITGEILLSACVTAARADTTASVAALAFEYAALPSYYVNVREAAATVADKDPISYEWRAQAAGTATQSVQIRHVLYSLSPMSRTIVWMCDVEGMTLSESATILGVSTATAYRRLRQAHDDFVEAWNA